MNFSLTRRTLGTALAAALAVTLLPGAVADASAAETVTVKSLNSKNQPIEVTVPKNPKRIAVADYAVLDTLDHWGLAGDRVVALTKGTKLPYLPQYFEKGGKAKDIGTLKELDLEGLMASEPDVIFISGRLAKKYDELSQIAPVVFMTTDHNKGTFQSFSENSMNLAKIFGKEAEAKADIEHFQGRIERIREKSAGKTAIVSLVTSAHVNLLGTKARCAIISNEFGFKNVAEDANANHGNEASFELLLKLNPDYFFVLDRDSAIARPGAKLAKDVLANELVDRTKAKQEGHIVYLTPSAWYLAEGGYHSMNVQFTDVEKALGIAE
ncbi:siderophore ABC transporter substrate-binding protein [Sutterella sp.]|uniref:siderophore ABC transporter substrate-binding protein n=1 Tax=Sutterella sp. TaxID=1981025 RepID=UPI0026DEE82D|nr:ABC transporter substrate-binding protein [Sutterella sp.]MDO5531127.1 ABC transporter substrate-binding protein [Sutterella sp.]